EFGWETVEADGHDVAEMTRVLSSFDYGAGAPHVVVARTIFGRGVSYMERQLKWHYLPRSESTYRQALGEVTSAACGPPSWRPPSRPASPIAGCRFLPATSASCRVTD